MSFNKCFVPGCTTGCNSRSKNIKNGSEPIRTLFKTPNNKTLFEKWKRNIPRGGVDLIPGCLVCEIHFPEESIVRYIETPMSDGTVCMIKRSKPALKPGAVPTIFPNLPPHLYRTLKRVAPPTCINTLEKLQKHCASQTVDSCKISKEESELILRSTSALMNGDEIINDSEVTSSENGSVQKFLDSLPKTSAENNVSSSTQDDTFKDFTSVLAIGSIHHPSAKLNQLIRSGSYETDKSWNNKSLKSTPTKGKTTVKEKILGNESEKLNYRRNKRSIAMLSKAVSRNRRTVSKQRKSITKKEFSTPDTAENFQIIIAEGENSNSVCSNETLTFICLKDNIEDVKVPSWHWSCSFLRNSIAFLDWGQYFDIKKKVIVNYDMKYKVFIMGKEIFIQGFEGPKSFQDLQNFLLIVEKITVCQGIEKGEEKQWSKNCFGFVPPREEGTKKIFRKRCDECVMDMKNAPSVKMRDEEKRIRRIQRLLASLNAEKMRNRGLSLMVQRFRQRVEKLSSQQKISKDKARSSKLLKFSKHMEAILNEHINDDEENVEEGTEAIVEESVVNMEDELFLA